jgi:hypothetical protein
MRTYQVWIEGMSKCIEVQAKDVNLEGEEANAFWNFIAEDSTGDNVTVSAFPFANVDYIVSVS